jgi:hypothetical protein
VLDTDKIRENRLRRMAARQFLRLEKSRTRDPRAPIYGRYRLVNDRSVVVLGATERAYEATLDEIERFLTAQDDEKQAELLRDTRLAEAKALLLGLSLAGEGVPDAQIAMGFLMAVAYFGNATGSTSTREALSGCMKSYARDLRDGWGQIGLLSPQDAAEKARVLLNHCTALAP